MQANTSGRGVLYGQYARDTTLESRQPCACHKAYPCLLQGPIRRVQYRAIPIKIHDHKVLWSPRGGYPGDQHACSRSERYLFIVLDMGLREVTLLYASVNGGRQLPTLIDLVYRLR